MVNDAAPAGDPLDMAEELHWQMFRIFSVLRRHEHRGMGPQELTLSQCSLLYVLHTKGPSRLTDLAAREGVSLPTVIVSLRKLQDLGLVARSRDSDDRRVIWIRCTARGTDTRRAAIAGILENILTELRPEEMDTLRQALGSMERLVVHTPDNPDGADSQRI